MLRFYHGSQQELLADELIDLYGRQPLDDPLAREIMVVQNHGMARWLSTRIARKSGIAANLKFEFPAERVWDLYRSMDASIPQDLPSDREPMTWTLFRLLGDLPQKSPYLAVWNYMRDNNGEWSALKAWKLANRIGDLFDQYLIYRPDMLLQWEEGRLSDGSDASEAWQAELWRGLNRIWNRNFTGTEWNHRADIHDSFMDHLKNGGLSKDAMPQRITLFGLSGLSPTFVEVFTAISEIIDVHWFWMDPTLEHSLSSLRESWGSEREEFLELFGKYTTENDVPTEKIRVNRMEDVSQHSTSQTPDLFDQPTSPPVDGYQVPFTLQVHSCHSPLREVEVLHNNLLDLFERDDELEPDDILILCPDIAAYAPFIQAVFGTSEGNLPQFPYHIVDDHTGPRTELFNTFSQFLELLESRFKVTEVLDLLSTRVIRQRFGISEEELERVQTWIKGTNVRWGISGDDKKKLDLSGSSRFTWIGGLDRMMLGFAAQPGDEIFRGIYPYGQVESSEDAILLGKFSRFLNTLSKARQRSEEVRRIEEWVPILRKWIKVFMPTDSDYYRAFQGLNALVTGLENSAELGDFKKRTEYSVLFDYLKNKLTDEAARGGYFGHGITFSGLEQMRSIPFRMIGMIGMNNEAFPRTKISPDFDLMSRSPQPGDRARRNDDRYLFLETMQSAKEHFYLSYVGQSNRDDSSRPPSVMISELTDYLQEEQGLKREEILVEHPLHSYSSRYFKNQDRQLFSYSPTAYEVHQRLSTSQPQLSTVSFLAGDERLPEADDSYKQISISDLVRFYEHPARYLAQQRLGVRFQEQELVSDDREPFELRGLEGYKLGEELLMRRINSKDITGFEPIARARGMLPEGWPGRQEFRDKVEEVSDFSDAVRKLLEMSKLERVEVSLEFANFHLTGVLDSLYRDYQLFFRYGSRRPKDMIKQWIFHLVLLQLPDLDHSHETLLVTKKDNQPEYTLFSEVEHPSEQLHSLIEIYWSGIHRKVPLFTESSCTFAEELVVKGKDQNSALKRAKKKWEKPWRPDLSEKEDSYNKLFFNTDEPIESQEFMDLSRKIWNPVFNALNEEVDVE